MAATTAKIKCFICEKETSTFNCGGCSQNFCRNDLIKHLQILSKQLDEIENNHDELRQSIIEQKENLMKYSLIEHINQWEEDSINKIKQTAEESRQKLINYIKNSMIEIENQLNNITKELKELRQENEFNEIDLNQSKEKLNKLQEQLNKPLNLSIKKESKSYIDNILVITPFDRTWKQFGITIFGGNQFLKPHGIFIDDDQNMYIADLIFHRIIEWKYNAINGQIVAGRNGQGNQVNQLNQPLDMIVDKENNSLIIADYGNRRVMRCSRQNYTNIRIIISDIDCYGLAMDKNGSLYVVDWKKHEIKRWKRGDQNGTIVAGGNGNGDHLNQLSYPTYIYIDEDYSLYVSDHGNHRVMKWIKGAKEGIVVAGGNGQGNSLTQLSDPRRVIVDQLGQIYVVDRGNDRVMRWYEGAKEGSIVVGGNGQGQQANQLNGPRGLSFDRQGNLYVADCENDRIQKFEIN